MKQDDLIAKRFEELEAKAKDIFDAKDTAIKGKDAPAIYMVSSSAVHGWATNVLSLLQRAMGADSVHYNNFQTAYEILKTAGTWLGNFERARAVFAAAKEDFEGGYLFTVRGLVKAEVLDDALEQADELLRNGYKDPACVLVGVALETTLKELCTRQNLPHGKLDVMNVELRKAGLYNVAKQKQITAWADLRNNAAHGNWSEYISHDVDEFLEGVKRFIADYL